MTGTLRTLETADLDEVLRLRHVCFGDTVDDGLRARQAGRIDRGEVVGWDDGGVLAIARLARADHWFGGRGVPCQHVGSVAVPPEHRGRGVASALLRAVAAQGAAEGAGLSLLYPATTPPYRRLGWEQAGEWAAYRVPARAVGAVRGEALRPVASDQDRAAVERAQQRAWRSTPGAAVRTGREWTETWDGSVAYVLDADEPDEVQAYLVYRPRRLPGDWQYTLKVEEWGATTVEGLHALLAFVARHGSLGKDVELAGPVPHPWTFLAPEQDVRRHHGMYWMARALDLPAAVAARGFPAGVELAVAFRVEDTVVPEAEGPWQLLVRDGRGVLLPTDRADVVLDARAVGPLYTGFASPAALVSAGLLRGRDNDLALMGTAFAGAVPVLFDVF